MMRLLILVFCALLPFAALAAETDAGMVIHLQDGASAEHQNVSRNLSPRSPVQAGDRIVTGRDARLVLRMADGATLTLGADTEFVIRSYSYSENEQQGSALLELVKGVFRATTGAIGKLKAHDFKVKTAFATIGIRGTDFWGGFYFSEALDVALLGGAGIYVENAAGRIEVDTIGEGTTIGGANAPPSPPKRWDEKKLNAAKQSVAWKDDAH